MHNEPEQALTPDRLLSIEQLAVWLGVPTGTVRAWRLKGSGPPSVKVGKHVRYRRADIEAWLDARADSQ